MIDSEGFRENVGIVLSNKAGKVFLAKRIHQEAWQFPQGGVNEGETIEQAMYRELREEIGLGAADVRVLAQTERWLRYRLPKQFIRHHQQPLCIGQKQKWFLLRLEADDATINLATTDNPEFDAWRWTFYWNPVKKVIGFKRRVYVRALKLLRPALNK